MPEILEVMINKNNMVIAGLEKQSLIDWEGNVSAVIFTKGCNFRCIYCHNKELVYPCISDKTLNFDENSILNYLKSRHKWLDGIVITGGEPTIQVDLLQFIYKLKQLNFCVKLDTNGSNPTVLHQLIKHKLIDYVALDIKTVLEPKEYQHICNIIDNDIITKINESINILRYSNINYQLRTTVLPHYHTDKQKKKLKETLSFCNNYVFQNYRETNIVIQKSNN
ncbi:MAG: anaerobic ribonucleoside-triphosphate reductase activating protein [Bacteroidales bacterium]